MDNPDVVISSHEAFLRLIDEVGPDTLGRQTPCAEWDVAALLRHVTGGNRMAVSLVGGAPASAIGPIFADVGKITDDDIVEACRRSVREARDVLVDLPDPDGIVHFPIGDIPAAQLQTFRISDLTLHTWDLARAIGADETLPPDAVELALTSLTAMAGTVPPGMFGEGPSGAIAKEADPQARLLDLSGRRP
jgi:uncharacterized protein (TIGR03086 family)